MGLLDIVLPVFAVVGLGYGLARSGLLARSVVAAMSRLVFYVAAPCLLARSLARTHITTSTDTVALGILITVSVVTALAVYLACGRAGPARRGVIAQGAHRSNMVFMGLPVVANAYGDAGLAAAAVPIGVMVVLYNLLAVLVLVLPHRARSARTPAVWTAALREIVRNPLVLACAAGAAWSATGLALPVSLDRSLELVGRVAAPLALICVGAALDLGRLRTDLRATLGVAAIKLVAYPAAVALALHAVGRQGLFLAVPVLLMAAPTAVVSAIMAREMHGDEQLADAVVIGTTAFALPTYVGWLLLLRIFA